MPIAEGRTFASRVVHAGDGLSDGDEVKKYKTDPAKADSDGDSLSDGEEINNLKTNPNKGDSDGDGLSDSEELGGMPPPPLFEVRGPWKQRVPAEVVPCSISLVFWQVSSHRPPTLPRRIAMVTA